MNEFLSSRDPLPGEIRQLVERDTRAAYDLAGLGCVRLGYRVLLLALRRAQGEVQDVSLWAFSGREPWLPQLREWYRDELALYTRQYRLEDDLEQGDK